MGREAIKLDKVAFQAAVTSIEQEKQPKNRSELWKLVAESDFAKNTQPRPLTVQVAYIKAGELGIVMATPVGKKGSGLAAARLSGTKRTSKRIPLEMAAAVFKTVPESYHGLVKKMLGGSLKAGRKLNCLQCSNWQPSEVRHCGVHSCVNYPVRPFQQKVD